jgi:transcriptional antiterminator NusG
MTNENQNQQEKKENKSVLQISDADKNVRRWYAVHTYSGYEDAVARYLKQRVESLGMTDKIFNVIVPKEQKIKIKNGKRKVIEEKIYPGYVLVDMIMSEDSWYVVRNTPRVMGFVGPDSTKPTPLSKDEVEHLMLRMEKEKETKFKVDYSVGDLVKIIDGPFKDYEGKIVEVDQEHGRIKVVIPVFGRDTQVEIDSLQVQKI